MEDDQNERRPQWKMTKMEDDQNGRRPKWKTTKMENNQNERQPKWTSTKKKTISKNIKNKNCVILKIAERCIYLPLRHFLYRGEGADLPPYHKERIHWVVKSPNGSEGVIQSISYSDINI